MRSSSPTSRLLTVRAPLSGGGFMFLCFCYHCVRAVAVSLACSRAGFGQTGQHGVGPRTGGPMWSVSVPLLGAPPVKPAPPGGGGGGGPLLPQAHWHPAAAGCCGHLRETGAWPLVFIAHGKGHMARLNRAALIARNGLNGSGVPGVLFAFPFRFPSILAAFPSALFSLWFPVLLWAQLREWRAGGGGGGGGAPPRQGRGGGPAPPPP